MGDTRAQESGQRTLAVRTPQQNNLPALPKPQLFGDLTGYDRFVEQIAARVHLLSPVVSLDHIPEFWSCAVRYVRVDSREAAGEVYVQEWQGSGQSRAPKTVSLTKVSLDKIAAAAGISWHPTLSARLDDASDPHYCHFRAVGYHTGLDGRTRLLPPGEKETDLRDGNPSIYTDDPKRMAHEYDRQAGRYTNRVLNAGFLKGWSQDRLDQARTHILAMTQSKAMNRVIRSLGVKHKYTPTELEAKPFAVVTLVYTGRSEDPELQRLAKLKMLERADSAADALFGPAPRAPRAGVTAQLEQTPAVLIETPGAKVPSVEDAPHAPPPVSQVKPDPEEVDPASATDVPFCACPDGPAGQHDDNCAILWAD